ncbi:MAG: heat-inducible transcriptional repressor HrcA [Actinomycetia bacterium]|nr:heat-inducible transcriptional repressor HrcA [Actinomycetes bacterium]
MLEERRLAVLQAIVTDYVATHEPVGSKGLVDRHQLGVSPATIRNDMASLEEEGYITAPHTSAGRIPTDLGYRMFVDQISQVKPLSVAERKGIDRFLSDAVDLDDIMSRTLRLLAQLTKQVAVVQYPSLSRSHVRRIELIPLNEHRLMIMLIVDSGRVEQRIVECSVKINEELLADLRDRLSTAIADQPFSSVPQRLDDLEAIFNVESTFRTEHLPLVRAVIAAILETVTAKLDERVMLGGASNLARYNEDFPMTIQPVLEALEEQVVLLRLLGEVGTETKLSVRIGHENEVEGLSSTSIVSSHYAKKSTPVASLGVIGPTNMDYANSMSTVQAVAQYVSRFLSDK